MYLADWRGDALSALLAWIGSERVIISHLSYVRCDHACNLGLGSPSITRPINMIRSLGDLAYSPLSDTPWEVMQSRYMYAAYPITETKHDF